MGKQYGQLVPLDIRPGFYTEDTDTGGPARWIDGDLVRWKNAMAQRIGGWEQQVLSDTILGIPRSLHDWVALDGAKYIAVGTEKRLYIIEEDFTVNNVTPIRDSGTLGANPIDTDSTGAYDPNGTGDASFVNISDTNHGVSVGDIVNLTGASPVGGITISGDYEVKDVPDADNFVIQHSSPATSTANGGGAAVNYIYEITAGSTFTSGASGWGTGGFGEETWDTPRTASTFTVQLRTWSLDNWGEDLIASPRGGAIYVWDKSSGFGTRATIIANAPSSNLRVLVSELSRQIISFGANTGSSDDPLFIAWCDSEDYTNWTPDITNTAGDARIDQGSRIVAAIQTRGGVLVFTDTGAHMLQPVGSPDIYLPRKLGDHVSIASPSAAVDVNGIVYAMGKTNFYVYDGTFRVMPCDVWTKVYDQEKSQHPINTEQYDSVFCSHVKDFNEVWWFYPVTGQGSNSRYVVYNYVERVWYYGELDRSSFHDFSPFIEKPYGLDDEGRFFIHEEGYDAVTKNPPLTTQTILEPYLQSSYIDIENGNELMHVSQMIPDLDRVNGNIRLVLYGKKWPQSTPFFKGPYTFSGTTEKLGVRIRARHISLYLEQRFAPDQSFRIGQWRAIMRKDGER